MNLDLLTEEQKARLKELQDDEKFIEWLLTNEKLMNDILGPITAAEVEEIMQSDDPFSEEELNDIIDTELKKHYTEIDTDLVDVCVSAILKNNQNEKM
jgi:hypothetical protein